MLSAISPAAVMPPQFHPARHLAHAATIQRAPETRDAPKLPRYEYSTYSDGRIEIQSTDHAIDLYA